MARVLSSLIFMFQALTLRFQFSENITIFAICCIYICIIGKEGYVERVKREEPTDSPSWSWEGVGCYYYFLGRTVMKTICQTVWKEWMQVIAIAERNCQHNLTQS